MASLSASGNFSRRAEAALLAGIIAFLALIPALPSLFPCPILALTGRACPTCGITRSLWSVLHGRWAAAWALNPMGFIVLLILIRRLVQLSVPPRRLPAWLDNTAVEITLLAVACAAGLWNWYIRA